MALPFRDLTDAEREEFLKENLYGILAFSSDKPYNIPMGYYYRKGALLLKFSIPGRKVDCYRKSPSVCFTICKPRWQILGLKKPCTTAVVEGQLEEVVDRAYYGFEASHDHIIFRIKVDKLSARKCTNEPCELFAQPWVSAEAYARWMHDPKKSV